MPSLQNWVGNTIAERYERWEMKGDRPEARVLQDEGRSLWVSPNG
ncbi:hypothetical protein P7L53_15480 [Thermoleptolyngbya sichuanensis XZ-Cy5]|nr:hypothetical protein [Thermoleptolyngbya sichuanensis]MDG2617643.1 hypothetical protein [Thermoleptolyngbya sichuanensis XZ-Cy5]